MNGNIKLPDYNAPKEELIEFLESMMSRYTRADKEWYEFNSWRAVVANDGSRGKQFLFDVESRKRLFKWLKKYT